jgi:hypothetical protein
MGEYGAEGTSVARKEADRRDEAVAGDLARGEAAEMDVH